MYAFPAPGAPVLIPEECSAENNSVTVAWQPPPGHGIMGCAGQRGPAIEGYLLELDDGCGGEFRVSKHSHISWRNCTPRKCVGRDGYWTLGSDLEAFLRSPMNSSMALHSSGSSTVLVSLLTRRPVPVFLYRALLRPYHLVTTAIRLRPTMGHFDVLTMSFVELSFDLAQTRKKDSC